MNALVSKGGVFSESGTVTFRIGGSEKKLRRAPSGRILRSESAAYVVILVFFVLFGLLLF